MSNKLSSLPKTAQRRRGATLEGALLEAAWQELKEVGYKHFSFDSVAQRAGTSKAVLYRRWRNRLELVRAAMRSHKVFLYGPTPDTGSLHGDVKALLTRMAKGLNELQPDVVWGVLTDAVNYNDQPNFVHQQVRQINVQVMTEILERAERRNEVDLSKLPGRVITLPADLARHEMLITGKPPTKAAIDQIVDNIFLPLVYNASE